MSGCLGPGLKEMAAWCWIRAEFALLMGENDTNKAYSKPQESFSGVRGSKHCLLLWINLGTALRSGSSQLLWLQLQVIWCPFLAFRGIWTRVCIHIRINMFLKCHHWICMTYPAYVCCKIWMYMSSVFSMGMFPTNIRNAGALQMQSRLWMPKQWDPPKVTYAEKRESQNNEIKLFSDERKPKPYC